MIRRPPRSTLFPTRRSSDLRREGPESHPSAGTTGSAAFRPGGPCCGQRAPDNRRGPRASSKDLRVGMLRSEEHTSELQSLTNLVCRLLLEKKKKAQEAGKHE